MTNPDSRALAETAAERDLSPLVAARLPFDAGRVFAERRPGIDLCAMGIPQEVELLAGEIVIGVGK